MKRWIGIPIIIVCMAGLIWAILPVPVISTTYESKDPAWSLKIEQPEYMRAGENATLTVEVTPPDLSGAALDTSAVAVRLDLPGLFQGANQATQMVALGRSVRFPWTIGPGLTGHYEGRVWIYYGLQKTLLNARTIQVEVRGPDLLVMYILRIVMAAGIVGGVYLVFFWRPRLAI
jgi:hypothetical protein